MMQWYENLVIKKVKQTHSKSHTSKSAEILPLTPQVSPKGNQDESKGQIWIVLVPLLEVLVVNISLILCYVLDLSKQNVPPLPFIPTISQVGNQAPTSYIFTFGMTASSLTTFLVVFFRYKQVSFTDSSCCNTISVTAGYLAALSKLLVGAFQYHPNFKWLHYSAFISYVFFSYAYVFTQVILTYYTKTVFSTGILLTRLILSMLMVVFGGLFCGVKLPRYEKLNHPPYNVAQLAQWTYWTFLNTYTLTFTVDFTRIRVSWNFRTSSNVRYRSAVQTKASGVDSHELYCADSDISKNHVLIGRKCSNAGSKPSIPPKVLTTSV